MDKLAIRQKERGERVILFAAAHPKPFAVATSEAAQDLVVIKREVAFLATGGTNQMTGAGQSGGATGAKTQLLRKMESDVRALRRTFDRIKTRDASITFDLDLPADRKEQTLVDTATAYLGAITPLKAKFIARGKSADFLDDLQNDLSQYAALVAQQQSGAATSENTTSAIDKSLNTLVDAIDDLDDIMDNLYEGDPLLYAEWNRASKLGTIARNPGNAHPKPPTPPLPPA